MFILVCFMLLQYCGFGLGSTQGIVGDNCAPGYELGQTPTQYCCVNNNGNTLVNKKTVISSYDLSCYPPSPTCEPGSTCNGTCCGYQDPSSNIDVAASSAYYLGTQYQPVCSGSTCAGMYVNGAGNTVGITGYKIPCVTFVGRKRSEDEEATPEAWVQNVGASCGAIGKAYDVSSVTGEAQSYVKVKFPLPYISLLKCSSCVIIVGNTVIGDTRDGAIFLPAIALTREDFPDFIGPVNAM